MKRKEFISLRSADKVMHKHYGVCTVVEYVPYFGPTLLPDTDKGKALLSRDSGASPETPLLETSLRLLQVYKEESP
jgi:hypothetical protein